MGLGLLLSGGNMGKKEEMAVVATHTQVFYFALTHFLGLSRVPQSRGDALPWFGTVLQHRPTPPLHRKVF